jgi:hypothetical protein
MFLNRNYYEYTHQRHIWIALMSPTTLQALRRLLFFSRPEAAELIGGVTERSWNYWEEGKRPVPADVTKSIQHLVAWRENALQTTSATISEWKKSLPKSGGSAPPALIWYASAEDWGLMPDREPIFWRPHCSVIAELCARHGAVAIQFDGSAYAKWLKGRKDTESMRSQWAAER